MLRGRRTRSTRLYRQLALARLQDAMGRLEEERECSPAGYPLGTPPDGASLRVAGMPGGLQVAEYVDMKHPYPMC